MEGRVRLDRCEPDGLADLLRREAARGRPLYSAALHERLLRQLAVDGRPRTVIRAAEHPPAVARHAVWWRLGPAVAVAALVAMVVAIIGLGPDWADGQPQAVAVAPAGAGVGDAAGAEALGIDRVPMFDELDAGVREGVSTLAATLLDVPEWRMLADFDAAGFLGMEAGR